MSTTHVQQASQPPLGEVDRSTWMLNVITKGPQTSESSPIFVGGNLTETAVQLADPWLACICKTYRREGERKLDTRRSGSEDGAVSRTCPLDKQTSHDLSLLSLCSMLFLKIWAILSFLLWPNTKSALGVVKAQQLHGHRQGIANINKHAQHCNASTTVQSRATGQLYHIVSWYRGTLRSKFTQNFWPGNFWSVLQISTRPCMKRKPTSMTTHDTTNHSKGSSNPQSSHGILDSILPPGSHDAVKQTGMLQRTN